MFSKAAKRASHISDALFFSLPSYQVCRLALRSASEISIYPFGVAFLRRGAQKRVGRGAVTPMGIYAIRMALGCLHYQGA